jgi:lipopolysaccharide export system permease protein
MVSPDRMSLRHLSAYTKHLSDNHQKTNRYDIAFWKKVVYPLAALVMVALALPFAGATLPGHGYQPQDLFRGHDRHPVSHAQRLVLESRGDQQLVTAAQRGHAIGVVPAGGGDMIWWVERR